jgi:hypothetical protein
VTVQQSRRGRVSDAHAELRGTAGTARALMRWRQGGTRTRLQPSSCLGATGLLAVTSEPKTMSRLPRGGGRTHVSVSVAAMRTPAWTGRESRRPTQALRSRRAAGPAAT